MKDDLDTAIRFTPDTLYASERNELVHFAQEQFEVLFEVIGRAKSANALGAKVTSTGKTTRVTVFSTTRIHASLTEVKDIFCSEHTHFATGFAQSQQIYSLVMPSNKHTMRSAALRWSLWDATAAMARRRDVLFVEYMDAFVNKDGRRGWARCTHSIEHRSCPPLENAHNIVRAHMYCSGSIYTETDEPGVLEVVTIFDVDTRGLPAWVSKMVAIRKAQSATNVEHLIRLSRVMTDEDDPEVKLIEFQSKGKVCRGCSDRLSKWMAHRKCQECKEPLCRRCSEVIYYNPDERKKIKHICVYCVDNQIVDGEPRGDVSFFPGGLDSIYENGAQSTRRLHHMSFRTLRMARETNFSISPTSSSGFLSMSGSSASSMSLARPMSDGLIHRSMYRAENDPVSDAVVHRSMFRAESDPGMLMRPLARPLSHSSRLTSAPALHSQSAKSITV